MEFERIEDVIRVAVDGYRGNVDTYSVGQSQELLRKALIEANGGSSKMNYRDYRDGKCTKVFAIVEAILAQTIPAALREDTYINALVDMRTIGEGDVVEFSADKYEPFFVATIAEGTQGLRRQRYIAGEGARIPTKLRGVKIYEELNRVLSGKVDFNALIDLVALSFKQQMLADINAVWEGISQASMGGSAFFPAAGAYSEAALLQIVEHVEAASGQKAIILGTKTVLRNLAPSVQGHDSEADLYNFGYYGKFYGTDVVAIPQQHVPGTTNFAVNNKLITVVAAGSENEKPIKVVIEGDPLIIPADPLKNGDLTMEYMFAEKYGVGFVSSGNWAMGRYQISP